MMKHPGSRVQNYLRPRELFFAAAALIKRHSGLGYTITDLHELRWGIEMQPEVRETTSYQVAPYAPFRVGPRLDYWTPFVSREHTGFITETNK